MLKNIIPKRSEPAPHFLCWKSSQYYLEAITKLVPAWGMALKSKNITSKRTWVALWAAAVAVANACRISEVLAARGSGMLPNGMVVTVGSKGSNARMIWTAMNVEDCTRCPQQIPSRPVFCVGYKEVWQAVVLNGFAVQEPGHQNRSVTHSGRYSVMQKAVAILGEDKAGEVIGHKSKRSNRYYTRPEECAHDRAARNAERKRKKFFTQGPQLPDFMGVDNA